MAKAKKRPTKSSARAKPAKKKPVAAKKSKAKSPVAATKKATKKAAPKTKPTAPKKAPVRSSAATPVRKPVERVAVKPQRPEPPAPRQTVPQGDLSPDTKKKLAAQHMWDLVQAKKQRAAQPPAWHSIEHHDHPAPRTSPDLSSDQGGSSIPPEMPGHRDRGTG